MLGSELGSELSCGLVQGGYGDPHGGERLAGFRDAAGASEGYECLAVGACGCEQVVTGGVGRFDVVDGVRVVGVGAIE